MNLNKNEKYIFIFFLIDGKKVCVCVISVGSI